MTARVPGRRALLGGTAALLGATGLPVGAEAAPDADTAICAACDRYVAAELAWRPLIYADDQAPAERYADAVRTPAMKAVDALPPARTMAGLRAKARAIVAFYDPDPPNEGPFETALWDVLTALAGNEVQVAFRRQREALGVES